MLYPAAKLAFLWPMSLDAGVSVWGLQRFGEPVFPGVSQAGYEIWPGAQDPQGRSQAELQAAGVLPINCGGGLLDHHPHGQHPGQCTFTRVLEVLELKNDLRFDRLAKYVLWDDTREGSAAPEQSGKPAPEAIEFALGRQFKDVQGLVAAHSGALEEKVTLTLNWLFWALDAQLAKQKEFLTEAADAFKLAQKLDVPGRPWRLVVGTNPCDQFPKYARSKMGYYADVVIHFRAESEQAENHQVQVVASSAAKLNMDQLAGRIRKEEARLRGLSINVTKSQWRCEGQMPAVPQWYYLPSRGPDGSPMLLNGSPRHRDVEPTKIPLDRLVTLVREWLATQ